MRYLSVALLSSLLAMLAFTGCNDVDPISPLSQDGSVGPSAKLMPGLFSQQGALYAPYRAPGLRGFRRLGKVDTRTGHVKEVIPYFGPGYDFPNDPVLVLSAAFDVDGTLYTLINTISIPPDFPAQTSQLAIIDGHMDEIIPVGDPNPFNLAGLEIDACGQIYATGFGGAPFLGTTDLYTLDKETGVATSLGATGLDRIMDLAFDSAGTLYATTANVLHTLDPADGQILTSISLDGVPIQRITGPNCDGDPECDWPSEVMSIAFDEDDVLYGLSMVAFNRPVLEVDGQPHGTPLLEIDPDTGDATFLVWTGVPNFHGGDIPPAKVTVCHKQGKGYQVIEVSLAALPAHLDHGDTLAGPDCGCDPVD